MGRFLDEMSPVIDLVGSAPPTEGMTPSSCLTRSTSRMTRVTRSMTEPLLK
jgi:hypothetical protein